MITRAHTHTPSQSHTHTPSQSHTHTHTPSVTHTHTHTQSHTHTLTKRDTHTHSHTHTHTHSVTHTHPQSHTHTHFTEPRARTPLEQTLKSNLCSAFTQARKIRKSPLHSYVPPLACLRACVRLPIFL